MGLQEGLQLVMEVPCHLWRAAFGQEWHEPHPLAGTSWILIYGHLLESMGMVQNGPNVGAIPKLGRELSSSFDLQFQFTVPTLDIILQMLDDLVRYSTHQAALKSVVP